jgi:hypothetical protein
MYSAKLQRKGSSLPLIFRRAAAASAAEVCVCCVLIPSPTLPSSRKQTL